MKGTHEFEQGKTKNIRDVDLAKEEAENSEGAEEND